MHNHQRCCDFENRRTRGGILPRHGSGVSHLVSPWGGGGWGRTSLYWIRHPRLICKTNVSPLLFFLDVICLFVTRTFTKKRFIHLKMMMR